MVDSERTMNALGLKHHISKEGSVPALNLYTTSCAVVVVDTFVVCKLSSLNQSIYDSILEPLQSVANFLQQRNAAIEVHRCEHDFLNQLNRLS